MMKIHSGLAWFLNAKSSLQPIINEKPGGCHRDHLEVSDRQPNPEPPEAPFEEYRTGSLDNAESVAIADDTADLHASSHHFERIRRSLRHNTRDRSGEKLRGSCQLLPVMFLRVSSFFMFRYRGVGRKHRRFQPVADGIVSQEGYSGVGKHSHESRAESTVEVGQSRTRNNFIHRR